MGRKSFTCEDIQTLSQATAFSDLTPSELNIVAESARIKDIARDTQIFREGDTDNCFFAVLSGWVKVYQRSPNGSCAVVGLHTTGETFAEASLFLGPQFDSNACTVAPSRICFFEHEHFKKHLANMPTLMTGVLRALSSHLQRSNDEVAHLQTMSGDQRLALFLLEIADQQGNPCEIALPYDKMLIAKRLGMRPESLSRNFTHLRDFGVQVEHKNIFIEDLRILRAHLSDPARGH